MDRIGKEPLNTNRINIQRYLKFWTSPLLDFWLTLLPHSSCLGFLVSCFRYSFISWVCICLVSLCPDLLNAWCVNILVPCELLIFRLVVFLVHLNEVFQNSWLRVSYFHQPLICGAHEKVHVLVFKHIAFVEYEKSAFFKHSGDRIGDTSVYSSIASVKTGIQHRIQKVADWSSNKTDKHVC